MAQIAKAHAAQQAAAEAQAFEATVAVLKSVRHDAATPVDWQAALNAPAPSAPRYSQEFEADAQRKLDGFQPTFFERIFGSAKRRAALAKDLQTARESDRLRFEQWQQQYAQAYQVWDARRRLAHGVLSGDAEAYRQALDASDAFDELEELGSVARVEHLGAELVEVDVFVNSDAVIPPDIKTVTSTGKLSTKKMPVGQFYELYQDYVCGSALRVARDVFAVLPVTRVHVHAIAEMLNPQTGHLEHSAILSVAMPRETIARLRFEGLDASDSMRNFVHNMKFKKTAGFAVVEPLALEETLVSRNPGA